MGFDCTGIKLVGENWSSSLLFSLDVENLCGCRQQCQPPPRGQGRRLPEPRLGLLVPVLKRGGAVAWSLLSTHRRYFSTHPAESAVPRPDREALTRRISPGGSGDDEVWWISPPGWEVVEVMLLLLCFALWFGERFLCFLRARGAVGRAGQVRGDGPLRRSHGAV